MCLIEMVIVYLGKIVTLILILHCIDDMYSSFGVHCIVAYSMLELLVILY